MLTNFLLKYYFRLPKDLVVFLGEEKQTGSLIAILYLKDLWKSESWKNKIKHLFRRSYIMDDKTIKEAAHKVFTRDVFGENSNHGDPLLRLMTWHNSQKWEINALTLLDQKKAAGLDSLTVLTRTIFSNEFSNYLDLNLADRTPLMCGLVVPMVIKVPVISIRNYLDIHVSFTFNSIRLSDHPKADDLISYLYDILFIQQKIANSLHEYLVRVAYIEEHKKSASLIKAEISAIMGADLVFSYLKASIEKTLVFIGLIFEISNLETKKTHKQRLAALVSGLPVKAKELPYFEFIHEFIKSENIEELNNYRSGLLHKKGISDLQPHNYVGQVATAIPLRKIYEILLEQHAKNTAVLLGTLALLTDDLVFRDPPQLPLEKLTELFNLQNPPSN